MMLGRRLCMSSCVWEAATLGVRTGLIPLKASKKGIDHDEARRAADGRICLSRSGLRRWDRENDQSGSYVFHLLLALATNRAWLRKGPRHGGRPALVGNALHDMPDAVGRAARARADGLRGGDGALGRSFGRFLENEIVGRHPPVRFAADRPCNLGPRAITPIAVIRDDGRIDAYALGKGGTPRPRFF